MDEITLIHVRLRHKQNNNNNNNFKFEILLFFNAEKESYN